MKWRTFVLLGGLVCGQLVLAQEPPPSPSAEDETSVPRTDPEAAQAETDREFRDTRGYAFPALSRTVRDLQHVAFAFQLRDYCADERVPDEFVRVQLARFSLLTGRDESCRSLGDY